MHYNLSAFLQLFASQQIQESQSRRVSVISLFLFTSGTAASSTAKAFMLSLCSHSSVSTLQRAAGSLQRSCTASTMACASFLFDKMTKPTPLAQHQFQNKHLFSYFGTDHRARISFLCQLLPPTHELSSVSTFSFILS